MTLSHPQEKLLEIIEQRHLFFTKDQITVREIFQLTGKLCYSAIAVLPAIFHCRPFQMQQIFGVIQKVRLLRRGEGGWGGGGRGEVIEK